MLETNSNKQEYHDLDLSRHPDLPMTVPIVEVTPVLNKSIETLTIPANSARSKASTRELQGQPLGTT